ncbi:MAG: hypothetical protein ACP5GH_00200 [Nitrososphaeria archaeon]
MSEYVMMGIAGLSFAVTILLSALLERALRKRGLMVPDAHKPNSPMVPRPGGPAIMIGLLMALLFVHSSVAIAYVMSTFVAFLIGLADDLKKFGGPEKPLLALLAALPVILLHAYLPSPHLPFVGKVTIKILYPFLILIGYPIYTNATNMIDVFNGVVSGTTAISVIPIIIYDYLKGNYQALAVGLAFEASVAAFFMFHNYPSRIFPGDSGSMLMGAGIVGLMIISHAEVIGIVATLPLIFNGFFILSSIKGFKEHSGLVRPLIVLDDFRMIANKDPRAPVTIARLLASREALNEKQLISAFLVLAAISMALSLITMLVFYI